MWEHLQQHATTIREHIVQMVYTVQSGHLGGSLSATDILTYLYFHEMDINKDNVHSLKRDRFVLSKGHASPLLYAVLKEKGLLEDELTDFRQINTHLQGHPNMREVSGVDMSTGSLGQGISSAVGMALANRLDKVNHRIYALVGDGECEEGQVWEAMMAAAHYRLHNLCVILDHNGLQIDGNIQEVMNPYPFKDKFMAFNWNVITCNGHDFMELSKAFEEAKETQDKPTIIIANTSKGKGVSFMEGNAAWHGTPCNEEQYLQARKELRGDTNDNSN